MGFVIWVRGISGLQVLTEMVAFVQIVILLEKRMMLVGVLPVQTVIFISVGAVV